jgi:hypothetical protein
VDAAGHLRQPHLREGRLVADALDASVAPDETSELGHQKVTPALTPNVRGRPISPMKPEGANCP